MQIVIPKTEQGRAGAVERFAKVLTALDAAKAWEVTVAEKKPRRSEHQNRFLWGVCYREIAKSLDGWDIEDIHEYCLGECFGWETLEGFGKKRLRPVRRSSKLSKVEFVDYVAWIQRTMAEKGIYIPDPEL